MCEGSLPHRAVQRQHAELEHVARPVRLGPSVEEELAALAPGQLVGPRWVHGGDRVLEDGRRLVARRDALGVYADFVAAEVVAQQLGREERPVGEPVGRIRQGGIRPHREGERLVLLDQVQEAVAAERSRTA